jgi:hypothetical protein
MRSFAIWSMFYGQRQGEVVDVVALEGDGAADPAAGRG